MRREFVSAAVVVLACNLPGCTDNGSENAAQAPPLVQSTLIPAAPVPATVVPAGAANVIVEENRTEVPLEDDSGTFVVPVIINDAISLKFTIDSGASYVTIPSDVASTLVRAGTITAADYVGSDTFVLADGSEVPSPEFRIKSLRVGKLVLHDVVASITTSGGSLLLGQTFLKRLKNWSIDNNRNVLILDARSDVSPATPATGVVGDGTVASSDSSPPSTASLEASADSTVDRYFAAWSNPSDPDGQMVRQYYGETVDYYGTPMTLQEVMGEKLRFAHRWPSRSYTLRENSIRTQCSEETRACKVAGLVDWRASSSARFRYSSGTATFSLLVDDGLIVAEHSRVLSRQ